MCFKAIGKLFAGTVERPSPSDIVPRTNITHDEEDNKVVLNLNNLNIPFTKPPKVWIPLIPDSNSMDPLMDVEHNNILIAGADEPNQRILVDFLKEGDVAVYRVPEFYAVHRIAEITTDSQGRKFKFKGDNNATADPYVVRDENIQWLSIGTIY